MCPIIYQTSFDAHEDALLYQVRVQRNDFGFPNIFLCFTSLFLRSFNPPYLE